MPTRMFPQLTLALAITGCAGPEIDDFAGTAPIFTPESYFLGRTTAWGYFVDRLGEVRREFTVDIAGRMEGATLVLDERFAYADGSADTRVWRITPAPDGGYLGTAGDVVGVAQGRAAGRMMQWTYEIDLPLGDDSVRVAFDDWLFHLEEGTMLGRTAVEKYGLALGEVVILFRQVPPPAQSLITDADEVTAPAS